MQRRSSLSRAGDGTGAVPRVTRRAAASQGHITGQGVIPPAWRPAGPGRGRGRASPV
ncbi:hypothetical protein BaRGS_00019835, partial [Batillaria attramentaria]